MAATPRLGLILAVVAAGSLVGGCGSGGRASATARSRSAARPGSTGPLAPAPRSHAKPIPTPAPTGRPADPAAVRVIRAWSSALRHGDVRGAARYFALPSLIANGTSASGGLLVITIHTRAEADAANATLPCGAEFLRADQRGRYVNVLFRLTNRPGPGGGCGMGVGQTARTNFVIVGGRIVEWIRAPEDPGDNRRAPPAPAPRSTSQPPGPVV
jgi:hypothetical protein